MRTRIAILMAVIATFGAVVAYRAVIAEEETSSGERRLEQGQILELNRRADLLDTYRESAVFEDSENLARERGFYLQEQARKARQTFPTNFTTANQLDLQAEEQFAIARMYRRTEDFNYVSGMSASATIESGIEKNVATELSEAGYGAVWKEPVGDKAPDIWSDLKEDIARSRLKTVCLSGLVAIFVLALAFLTFTQLPRDGSPVQRWLERLAIFIAVGASIACFVIDGHSWLPFLLAGLGIGVVALLGHLLYERPAVQQWLNGPKEVVIPEKERKAVAKAITEAAKAEFATPAFVRRGTEVRDQDSESAQIPIPVQKEAVVPAETGEPNVAAVLGEATVAVEGAKPNEAEIIREGIIRGKSAVEKFVAGAADQAAMANENHGEVGEEKEEEPSHPHEVGPRIAFIGAHLLAWDCTSTMNRFALSLIAVTALLAAICGWRYDCATAYGNNCAARAMEQQVAAFKTFERSQAAIHYVWGIDARMHEARIRYKAAEQRAELAQYKLEGVTGEREQSQ